MKDTGHGEKIHPLICACGRADCPEKDENIPAFTRPCKYCGAAAFELVHKSHHEFEERSADAHLGAHEDPITGEVK